MIARDPCPVAVVLMTLLALTAPPARAADNGMSITTTTGAANCINVSTVAKNRTIVECPANQVYNFCFTRDIADLSGLLSGALTYLNDPSYAGRSGIGWDEDQAVYHGVLRWETDEGVLMTKEVGVSDSKNGNYAGLSTVTGGTGRFENATGSMVSYGNSASGGVSSGTICLN